MSSVRIRLAPFWCKAMVEQEALSMACTAASIFLWDHGGIGRREIQKQSFVKSFDSKIYRNIWDILQVCVLVRIQLIPFMSRKGST